MNSIEKFCREIGMPGNNTGDGSRITQGTVLCALCYVSTQRTVPCVM